MATNLWLLKSTRHKFVELPVASAFEAPRYAFSQEQASLKLTFEVENDATTFYGGRAGEPIFLSAEDVEKLPHDLVCTLFSGERERQIDPDLNLTPDICFDKEDGTVMFFEIATRDNGHDSAAVVEEAKSSKQRKYSSLIMSDIVSEYNILIVTHKNAYDRRGVLRDQWTIDQTVKAYSWGMMVKQKYFEVFPNERAQSKQEKASSLLDMFRSLPVERDEMFDDSEVEMRHTYDFSRFPEAPEMSTFGEYLRNYEKRHPEARKDRRVLAHVPFAVPDRRKANEVSLGDLKTARDESEFWREVLSFIRANATDLCSSKTYEQLEKEAFLESEDDDWRKPISQSEDFLDELNVRLNKEDAVKLALRGVMGKKMKDEPLVKIKTERSKLPFSLDGDFSHFESWFAEPLTKRSEPCLPTTELIDFISEDPHGLGDKIEEALSYEEAHAMLFLENVIREVSYNMHRNPKDRAGSSTFLVRPVVGFEAFVIIRTTRMSGSEGAPCFYAVVAKNAKEIGPFEKWHELSAEWKRTDFVSTSLKKAEQLITAVSTYNTLFGVIHELLLDGVHSQMNTSDIGVEKVCLRSFIAQYLEDSGQAAETSQLLRYYYMELITGMQDSIRSSEKIVSKWPEVVRSKWLAFLMRKWIDCHRQVDPDVHIAVVRRDPQEIEPMLARDEELDEEVHDGDQEQDLLTGSSIPTPWGFHAKNMQQILLSSYICVIHNKGEGNFLHGELQIIDKMLTTAEKAKRLVAEFGSERAAFIRPMGDPSKMKKFQHCPNTVAKGVYLVKKRIAELNQVSVGDWDSWFSNKILEYCLKATLQSVCTTKATTLPFDIDSEVRMNGRKIEGLSGRKKVFEELFGKLDDFTNPLLALNLKEIDHKLHTEEDGRILVTIFKKTQIGVREILVLTIWGRLAIKIYQDIYRGIAQLHPCEKLMNESSRSTFVQEHNQKVASKGIKYNATLKASFDKSKWAPSFSLHEFHTQDKCLLPKPFQNFARRVLKAHKRKILQLPRDLVKSFLSESRGDHLASEQIEMIRDEFLGLKAPRTMVGEKIPNFKSPTDMMMGILHYTSSVYHLGHMEVLGDLMTDLFKKRFAGVELTFSFEISSDDEGMLFTISCDDRELLKKATGFLMAKFKDFIRTVDVLFGLETSDSKSTWSMSEVFEFNSVFMSKNTVVAPVIKFALAATQQSTAETLHRRVAGLYSSLGQLRDNGGSGFLCHWVSWSQAIIHYRNLGWTTMDWFNRPLFELFPYKTSAEGCYMIAPPVLSGIVDGTYMNYVACLTVPGADQVLSRLCSYGVPADIDDVDSGMMKVYPVKKYKAALKRMGLEDESREDLVTLSNFESFLRSSISVGEEGLKMKYMILSPGTAASMTQLTKTHCTRMTPYLLWSNIYRTAEGTSVTRDELIRRSIMKTVPLPVNVLFPMHEHLSAVRTFAMVEHNLMRLDKMKRTRFVWVQPYYGTEEHRENIKDVLRWKWYGFRRESGTGSKMERQWLMLREELPFLSETVKDTLRLSPFDNLPQLLGFIENYGGRRSSRKILMRGSRGLENAAVIGLARFNTSSRHAMLATKSEIDKYLGSAFVVETGAVSYPLRIFVQKTVSRMKSWYEILKGANEEEETVVLEAMREDIRWVFENHANKKFLSRSTGTPHLDAELAKLLAMTGMINLKDLWERSNSLTIYEQVQTRNRRGKFVGDARAFVKRGGVSAYCVFSEADKHVTAYSTDTFIDLAANLPSRWRPDSVLNRTGAISPDSFDCIGLKLVNGNRVMVFTDEMAMFEYYVQIPWVSPYAETHDYKNPAHSEWINGWLCRRPITEESLDDLAFQLSVPSRESDLCSASIAFAGSLSARKSLTQIEERIGAEKKKKETPKVTDWTSFANNILASLPEPDEEEMIENQAEAYYDQIADFIELNFEVQEYAFMAEPADYYNHSVSLNTTFRKLNEFIDQVRLIFNRLDLGMKTIVQTYLSAVTAARKEMRENDSDDE